MPFASLKTDLPTAPAIAYRFRRAVRHWRRGRLVYCFGQIGLAIAALTG
jgi:hypothetical protein